MIRHDRPVLGDASRVLLDGRCIDGARDGAPVEELLHHRLVAADAPVIRDRRVRVTREPDALFAKGAAGTRNVLWGASPVVSGAEPLLALLGAREVGVGAEVRDTRTRLAQLVQPLVRAVERTAVAGASVAAIEQVLDRELDQTKRIER